MEWGLFYGNKNLNDILGLITYNLVILVSIYIYIYIFFTFEG